MAFIASMAPVVENDQQLPVNKNRERTFVKWKTFDNLSF